MSRLRIKVVFLLLFSLTAVSNLSFAQTNEEKELIKTGEKLFKKQDFKAAVKVYSQLISSNSESADYNYRYGACLLYTSKKKSDALSYLKYAVKKKSLVGEAHFYLARAYHVSYEFEQAIKYYNQFKSSLKPKKVKEYQLDLLISECERAKEIIKDFKQIKVVSSKKLKDSEFFRAYKLGKLNRKILIKPDEFNSKEDGQVKSIEPKLVVHGPDQLTLVFSAYKKDDATGNYDKDLYMVTREAMEDEDGGLELGNWSSFQSLGSNINTNFDEEYPYLHPNGNVLYFSSKGHGGLGGYDIYKSELTDGEWGDPVNVGFSINSPFDDILYVVDQNGNAAYFSSDRQNAIGEITVYKIIPPQRNDAFILVKGDVTIDGEKSKKTTITIVNSKTGEFVGKYGSDKKTGSFIFPLVEKESYDIEFSFLDSLKSTVSISTPAKSDKEMMYQAVVLNPGRNAQIQEDLAFKASQEERAELISRMASLGKNQVKDVKFSPEAPKEVESEDVVASSDAGTSDNNATMSIVASDKKNNVIEEPADLLGKAELELESLKDENEAIEKEIIASYKVAKEKNDNVVALKEELMAILSISPSEVTDEVKQAQANKQAKLKEEISDASNALAYAAALEKKFDNGKKEEELSSSYVNVLSSVAESGSAVESIAKLEEYQEKLKILKEGQREEGNNSYEEDLNRKKGQLLDDKKSIASKVSGFKTEIKLVEKEKALLQAQIDDTRRKSVKQELSLQIEELDSYKEEYEEDLTKAKAQLREVNSSVKETSSSIELIALVKSTAQDDAGVILNTKEKEELIRNVSANAVDIASLPEPEMIAVSDNVNSYDIDISRAVDIESDNSKSLVSDDLLADATESQVNSSGDESRGSDTGGVTSPSAEESSNAGAEDDQSLASNDVLADATESQVNSSSDDSTGSVTPSSDEETNNNISEDNQNLVSEDIVAISKNDGSKSEGDNDNLVSDEVADSELIEALSSPEEDDKKASFSKTNVEPLHIEELVSSDVKRADEKQINELAIKIFNFPAPVDNETQSKSITRSEKEVNEKIQKALVIQKLVEEKKVEYTAESAEKKRSSLKDEIALLEGKVLSLKSDAALKRQLANSEKYRKKKEELDFELFVDPSLNRDVVIQKKATVDELWEKVAAIRNTRYTAVSVKEKDEILTNQMNAESEVIQAQLELEDLIKNEKRLSSKAIAEGVDTIKDKESGNESGLITSSNDLETADLAENDKESSTGASAESKFDEESLASSEINNDLGGENTLTTSGTVNGTSGAEISNDSQLDASKSGQQSNESAASQKASTFDEEIVAGDDEVFAAKSDERLRYESEKREEYKKKAESITSRAMQATDAYEQQKLFEEAALYELAADEEKLKKFNDYVHEEFTAYEENAALIEAAKKDMNKNSLSAEAFRLEEKSASLHYKAQEKLNEAKAEKDPLIKISKTNESKEIVAYSRLKQEEALKKYKDSARKPENAIYADRDFEVKPFDGTEGDVLADNTSVNLASNESNSSKVGGSNGNGASNALEGADNASNSGVEKADGISLAGDDLYTSNNSAISVEGSVDNSDFGTVKSEENASKTGAEKSEYLLAYEKLIKEAQGIEASEDKRRLKIEELKFLAQSNKDKSEKALGDAQGIKDDQQKEEKLQEANAFREQAEAREVAYKNEEYYMWNNLAEAKAKRNEAQLILDVLSGNERTGAIAINESNIVYPSYDFDESRGTYSPSTMTEKEGFKIIPTTRYTSRTVIPIDIELPSGLLYKVQVGAFRNKINPAIFNGITPLSGENAGAGITRYTAGLFRSFLAADMAKGRIRNLGYSDAFVVAFFNGKRISMEDADKRRNAASSNEQEDYVTSRDKEVKALKKIGITEAEANSRGSSRVNPIDLYSASKSKRVESNNKSNNKSETAAEAENINDVDGTYYTVQIGVYSSTRTSAQLLNISPLQTYNTTNGYIRYSTGVYRTVEEAGKRKNEVRSLGVSDAYVVGYRDGQRIDVSQPEQGGGDRTETQTGSQSQSPSAKSTDGVVFKVQIAAFGTEVNISNNPTLNQLSSFGIDYTTTSSGMLLYTVGSFSSKTEADDLKEQVVSLGISDAFIVAFNNGRKISVREATSLTE